MGRKPGVERAQQPEHRTLEGVTIRDLYAARPCSDAEAGGAPGSAPYVRGSRAPRDSTSPWWIVSTLPTGTPEQVNAAALEELEGGASGLRLPAAAAGWTEAQLARALDGVLLAGIALHLESGADAPALAVRALARAHREAASGAGWSLGADPLRHPSAEWRPVLAAARGTAARALLADAAPFHEAGAHAALELALLLAATAHSLQAGERLEIEPASVLSAMAWRVPMEREFFGGVVKLRAARLLWSALARAAGVADVPAPFLHACGSRRTLTRRDPHNNLVRATVHAAAAAVGGADAVSLPAFDGGYGEGSAHGRRLARNVALVVEHEGRLLDVQDPAGGSEHLESRTRELAAAAWESFREIERAGGLAAALADGSLRARLDAEWQRRRARLAAGEETLVGVNLHPAPAPESAAPETCGAWGLPQRSEEQACGAEGGGR